MRQLIGVVLLMFISIHVAHALEDTPQNRTEQASRYLNAAPLKETLKQIMLPATQGNPAEAKKLEAMFKYIDYDALDNAQREALVNTFTADELAALTDLYTSPAGRSAISKMGIVLGKAIPLMIPEYEKAQAAAIRELAGQQKQ
jgi:hypothetical protein